VEDQVRVELPPLVTVAGLNDAEQLGGGTTVTLDAHVFVPPDPLFTVKVHVWVAVGVSSCAPLRALSVLLPRLPVHVYGIWPSASCVEDHERFELPPVVTVAGLKPTVQVGVPRFNVTVAVQVAFVPTLFVTV
jgi:hypothetical protein